MSMTLGEAQIAAGAQGADVKRLQEILTGGGYNVGPIDGIFGSQTLAAVKAFQLSKGLLADGVVGPNTWALLLAPPVQTPAPAPAPTSSSLRFTTENVLLVGLGAVVLFAVFVFWKK